MRMVIFLMTMSFTTLPNLKIPVNWQNLCFVLKQPSHFLNMKNCTCLEVLQFSLAPSAFARKFRQQLSRSSGLDNRSIGAQSVGGVTSARCWSSMILLQLVGTTVSLCWACPADRLNSIAFFVCVDGANRNCNPRARAVYSFWHIDGFCEIFLTWNKNGFGHILKVHCGHKCQPVSFKT